MLTNSQLTGVGSEQMNSEHRRILLFNLSVDGHHATYIQYLVRYWQEQNLPGYLDIVVAPKFLQQHQDVVELARVDGSDRAKFIAITESEGAALGSQANYIQRKLYALRQWNLLGHYAKTLGATECVLLYFDIFQLSAVLRRKLPCSFSGIYFRPRFHYSKFSSSSLSRWEHLQHWREQLHIAQVLQHPQLKTLYCLDPFAVDSLNQLTKQAKVFQLPDPVEVSNQEQQSKEKIEALKSKLGIEADRQVFLLFGLLDGRKGIHQLLDALSLLPTELCKKLCLVLVGKTKPEDEVAIKFRTSTLSQSQPVQIVGHHQFVPEQDVPMYFQLADVVLAPYQKHVGTSGILLLAAAAGKPVLSSSYGVMGELVHRHELGLAVDSTLPREIAKGIAQFLLESPEQFYDPNKARLYAEQNSAEKFASTILRATL